jgi:hypothetical protein
MELRINFHHRTFKTVLFNAALNYVPQLAAAPVRQAPAKPSLFAVVVNAKNRLILRKWNFHNFTLPLSFALWRVATPPTLADARC